MHASSPGRQVDRHRAPECPPPVAPVWLLRREKAAGIPHTHPPTYPDAYKSKYYGGLKTD